MPVKKKKKKSFINITVVWALDKMSIYLLSHLIYLPPLGYAGQYIRKVDVI